MLVAAMEKKKKKKSAATAREFNDKVTSSNPTNRLRLHASFAWSDLFALSRHVFSRAPPLDVLELKERK